MGRTQAGNSDKLSDTGRTRAGNSDKLTDMGRTRAGNSDKLSDTGRKFINLTSCEVALQQLYRKKH